MNEPQIKGLSYRRRQFLFFGLLLFFLLSLPAIVFYTTGYRLTFEDSETNIVSVGGMYVTAGNEEVGVFLDEVQVEKPRLFRSAYYIQNIAAGQHRVVVQRPDLQTWVKELPVDAHLVTETAAFNMPALPHLRPITEYVTDENEVVFFVATTSEVVLPQATSTIPLYLSTSTATTSYRYNQEFAFVKSLFSTTSTSTQSVFERLFDQTERFRFATTSPLGLAIATSTTDFAENGNMRIVERDEELYARWLGTLDRIPYYFCISNAGATTTALRYGQHVAEQIAALALSTTTPLNIDNDRVCRPEIKLDRLRQDVYFYDFYPDNQDLVVLQLEDGLYVTEIDDRAWQNIQLIYPGRGFRTVVQNDGIYVEKDGNYFEIMTEIEP